MFLRALLVVVLGATAFATFAERDLAGEIARLSSPEAAVRGAAQRWLAAHLRATDRVLIRDQVRGADAEARGRWTEILASEDRLAFLSATLAASDEAQLASVGRAALEGAIWRWSPAARDAARFGGELDEAMKSWLQPRLELDAALATAPLEDVLDLVARTAPGRIGLVVDPRCDATRRSGTNAIIVGSFTSVLREIAVRHEAQWIGFACTEAQSADARWLVLVPKARGPSVERTALDLLRDWSITCARAGDPAARSAAARALASSGWPTGVALLAQCVLENGDAAALDGLMLAARRGRVAAELYAPDVEALLRAETERGLADTGDARRAIAAALALGGLGTRGPAGEDLCASAFDALATLTGRALFARVVELEARRPNDAASRAALDSLLAREDTPIGARFLALEARARFAEPLDGLVRANEFVEFAARQGRLPDLSRWLRDARSFPPETWRDPATLPAAWTASTRAFVAGAWLSRGETATASAGITHALKAADASTRESLALAVRAVAAVASPSAGDALFAQLETRTDVERALVLRFVALSGGTGSPESADEVLATIARPAASREDLLLLGALAASPRGGRARARLVEAVSSPVAEADLLAALSRAIEEVRSTRDFELEREFENAVRGSLAEVSPALRSKLRVGRWPPPPLGDSVRLGDWDRSCARFGL